MIGLRVRVVMICLSLNIIEHWPPDNSKNMFVSRLISLVCVFWVYEMNKKANAQVQERAVLQKKTCLTERATQTFAR